MQGVPSAFPVPSFQFFLQLLYPGLGPLPRSLLRLPSGLFGVGAGLLRLKVAQVVTTLGPKNI